MTQWDVYDIAANLMVDLDSLDCSDSSTEAVFQRLNLLYAVEMWGPGEEVYQVLIENEARILYISAYDAGQARSKGAARLFFERDGLAAQLTVLGEDLSIVRSAVNDFLSVNSFGLSVPAPVVSQSR
ncbi:MAG: hypothetical protein AAGI88_00160 [Pseudomonadota bacterium]